MAEIDLDDDERRRLEQQSAPTLDLSPMGDFVQHEQNLSGGTNDLQRRAEELNKSLGLSDPGNIQSLLSGRADWDEYFKDETARANNRTFSAGGTGGSADTNDDGRADPGWFQGAGGQWAQGPLPAPNRSDPRVATTMGPLQNFPGFQFNDPYTKLYEETAQNSLKSLTGQNAEMQRLMDFISKQFDTLSTSQGYSPEELAVLQTQAFEPIEANRQASQKRALERASARGILPSSGVVQGEQTNIDTDFDKLRAAANRDVAINAINRKDANRNQALQLAKLGVDLPDQRMAQGLNVANLLYQIPRTAMMDANTIVNGSNPNAAISPYIQLMQQQQLQAQQNQARNDAFLEQLGAWLFQMAGG